MKITDSGVEEQAISHVDWKPLQLDPRYCSGQPGHRRPDYPHRSGKCSRCGKLSHVSQICKSGQNANARAVQRRPDDFCLRHDEMFVRGALQSECLKRTGMKHEEGGWNWSQHACSMPAIEFEREMSSGHFVRMYMFRNILNSVCEWPHGYEESEWSLMTSLIRLFCCP